MSPAGLRAVPWTPVLASTTVGAGALALDRWLVPSGPGSVMLWFGLAGFAAAAGFVLDESSAAVVDAVPVPCRVRTAHRLLGALLPLSVWLLGTAVTSPGRPALSWPALAMTGTGFIALTVGVAAGLRRSGHESPGELVAAGAGGVVVLSLVVGVPKVGPLLEAYDVTSRAGTLWVALTVVAVALVVWGGSDPLTRWGHPYRRLRT